ncbi:MAG: hypothetical protein DRQ47_00105 [Gammaproteobacteria bacterium]|nr:MAG: hypothetical protein DRQ47_00105 [Gammaproteobacteria bacterium]
MKLLIAEDDVTSQMILETVTREWGYDPIIAEDGEVAWQIMQQEQAPQLLLLDWEMPNLSGIDLCQNIRKHETDDPAFIILLTSRSRTEDIVMGLESGANEYIAKPFDNAELQARLKVGKRMLDLQSERKQAQKEKERLQKKLELTRKMEALGQITGSIAHDFNNILGITMGYTSMALSRFGKDVPAKMKEYLETAMESSERAKSLVAKMLTYTHGEEQEAAPLDFASTIESCINNLHAMMPDTIEISFKAEQDLPEILFDPRNLEQLVVILCENASDAMAGTGTINIRLDWQHNIKAECTDCQTLLEGDWIELSIADTGTGMSEEVIEHIFEPFYTTKSFGKGMGMAMLHGILNRTDIHTIIESTPEIGTKISLLFQPTSS